MKQIPDIIKEIAANEGCNHVEYIGILHDKDVYSISEIGSDGLFVTRGLPTLILWDGKNYTTITGMESLDILEQFDL